MAAAGTTTIRVRVGTRDALSDLAAQRGTSIQDAADDAAEALWREELARSVRGRIEEMFADPDAWASYLAEGAATEVRDGIG
ncbi:MAG: hypothetical protein QM733_10105 [Ilumatobacteraceae bacterium]